jgi:hypothetical protein
LRLVARGPAPVTRLPGSVPGTCFAGSRSSRSPPFAPPTPPPVARLCSLASLLLWRGQTSRVRASSATASHLPDADRRRPSAGRTRDLPVPVQRASAHARVFDHAGAAGTRAIAPAHVAFRVIKHVGLRVEDFSRLNGWPMRSPVNASPASSQMPPHDSGASAVRYTFTARDFHSLLFAGFAGALITSFPFTIDTQLDIEVLSS